MAFAKEYRDEITFVYYFVSCVLSFLTLLVGAIYLPIYFNRTERIYKEREKGRDQQRKEESDERDQQRKEESDRRDQQRKEESDRRDQQRKKETEERERRHQQMKEWRDFAETIRKEHNELKGKNIPSKISKVKKAFKKIHIYKDINGTDVLTFMMRDPDYESFKTKELDALREDLDSVYGLLNRCASLILLGRVPENVRAELGQLVTHLVLLTLPFYNGQEREIILTCLEHFGRVGNEVKIEAEWEGYKDEIIERVVPYVRLFRFGDPLAGNEFAAATSDSYTIGTSLLTRNRNYGDRNKFKFKPYLRMSVSCQPGFDLGLYNKLEEVHVDLEKEEYHSVFASKLREQAPNLNVIDKINPSDPDELVIVKALHEIRVYIHRLTEGKPLEGGEHINILNMHADVIKTLDQASVHRLCDRFIGDLESLKKRLNPYHSGKTFLTKFEGLHRDFCSLLVIPHSNADETHV